MHFLSRILVPVALLGSLAALQGCGQSNPGDLIESARGYLAKGDTQAAVIELKSALQKGPESGEARFLLGRALLSNGDPTGAEVELRKALDLRHAEDEVVPELARAMAALGQHQKIWDQFGRTQLTDPKAVGDFKATLAYTLMALGRGEQARVAAEDSLAAAPGNGPATLFMIRQQVDSRDIDGALAALDALIAAQPNDVDAWLLKANVLNFAKRDKDAALAAYRKAISLRPAAPDGHGGAMTVLLDRADLEGARTQLAEMRKALPKSPHTQYFEGYLALLDRRFDSAQAIAQQLLRVSPENPRVLQLAGLVQLELGSLAQAENLLGKALQLSPELVVARRGLVVTHLKRDEGAKALAVLQPLLDVPNPAAADWRTKAQAHVQQGQLSEAEAAFARAAKIEPESASHQTDLAVVKILRGDTDGGLAMLRSLAADNDSAAADLPLIATLMRKRDHAAALKAIDTLERKQPGRPVAPNLRAQVLLAQGDRAGAAQAFEQALKAQPTFLPAAQGLAELALAANDPAAALKVLDDAVKADPKSSAALLESVKLRARIGKPRDEIVEVLRGAVRGNPQDASLRLALIDYQFDTQDLKGSLESAQQAVAVIPDEPRLIEALGRAQAATGDANQASASFSKLAQLTPASPTAHMRLAQVMLDTNDLGGAIQRLRRALAIAPDNLAAQRVLVNAYQADGKPGDALAVARQVQQQRPKQADGYLFEGTVEGRRQRFEQAAQAYRAGMKATGGGTTDLAMGLHAALIALKQPAQADREAANWLRTHPRDTAFRFYLGDLALAQGDLAQADARYRDVLKLLPEQPQALNNVAWLMATTNKPGAVAMAQKANQLRPNSATFMDTLALAMASEGQAEAAVPVMRKALAIDPKNLALRLNLARILIAAGDRPAAKSELQSLAALGAGFPRQQEVSALLKTL